MAKRSDFAQKLLDDLRLRKERMAASSQTSNRSNSMAIIDAYSYAKQNYRGSKDMRTNDMGYRTGNARTRYDMSSRSSFSRESAQQIVPYGRDQGSQQMGDLSMALAFALENGGKLIQRTDSSTRNSMLGFLQQIGMRPIDLSKRERRSNVSNHRASTSQLPNFSPLQIEEISKGAQRLNQILRACSNGLNFDRYSIEIGKELLKGAMDLENSLKMLVNLQEASEYMVTPQRKNRIKLLKEDEEDDDSTANIAEEWRLDLPRFSFDKSARYNIQELERTGLNQRLPALTNSAERAHSSSRSASHSRSASFSYSSNVKSVSTFSEHKNQPSSSESKPEKARIPNVIAKLMGLDKLPESESATNTAKKNPGSKPKDEAEKPKDEGERSRRVTQETAKIVGQKAKAVENLASLKKQKVVVEANKNHVVHNTSFVFVKEKNPPANFSFEVVFDDEKPPWESSQVTKAATRSEKAILRKDEAHSVVIPTKQNTGIRMDNKEKERNQELKKNMEVHARNSLEASHLLPQKRQAEKQSSSGHKKIQNNMEIQQPLTQRKSVSEERDQSTKQMLQARKQKGNEVTSKSLRQNQEKSNKKTMKKSTNSIQSEGFPNGRHQDDQVRERSPAELNVDKDSKNLNPDQNPSTRVQPESESRKERARFPPAIDEKAVHVPLVHKVKNVPRVQKIESPRRIEEVVARRNGTLNSMTRQLRHQNSVLKEIKPRRLEKVGGVRKEEAEPRINESNIAATDDQLVDLAQQMNKEAEKATTLCISKDDDFSRLKDPETQAPNYTSQNVIPIDQQDQELKCSIEVPNELKGTRREPVDISSASDIKHEIIIESTEPISKAEPKPEPLTESENHLKQIIIKSQLFLNTAEALFKLDIPIDILHAGNSHDHHEDKRLTLDCGYELMRRKGIRQEVAVHPRVKVSVSFVKITTFDGLVRDLNKGFEKLRLYGRNGKEDCEADEYLPRMLENDVYNKDPDMNCMWDIGWNESMFAFIEVDEVVRDVEKHLLNGLLDDITGELFLRSTSVC